MKKGLLIVSCWLLLCSYWLLAARKITIQLHSTNSGSIKERETPPAAELVIEASRFKFDQPVYKIKKGEATKITLNSTDGIHGISIPN